ncbi:MAG: universal stress protein [Candidatus Hadarchaeota archaeon]
MNERILVGLDDSEESWDAFNYAIFEAERKNPEKMTIVYSEEKAGDEEYRAGESILEEAEEIASEKGIEVDTKLLVRGYDPEVDIVRFAEEKSYDHIIIGHRGRSGIGGALLGSVAEGVVENAPCSVTVVRSALYIEKDGNRVWPRRVESLLEEHEGIDEAVVVGVRVNDGERKIAAFFEPVEGYEPPEEMVMDFLEDLRADGKIEGYAIPDKVVMQEKLPRTGAKTVNRDKLRDKYKKDFA